LGEPTVAVLEQTLATTNEAASLARESLNRLANTTPKAATTDKEFDTLLRILLNSMVGERSFSQFERSLAMGLAANDRPHHSSAWLKERVRTLLSERSAHPVQRWGWKEPNSHIVIHRLLKLVPRLKYVHVSRNGLDMAHSTNQNQFQLWAPLFLKASDVKFTPRNALRFWCEVERRIQGLAATLPDRVFLLQYDHLCAGPEGILERLFGFLHIDVPREGVRRLARLIVPAPTIGRHKSKSHRAFDKADVAFVESLGFDVGR
jgi:hypothetical protein